MTGVSAFSDEDLDPVESTGGLTYERVLRTDDASWMRIQGPAGSESTWHHHGDRRFYSYVVSGRVRIEYGTEETESTELGAGDFLRIAPETTHRKISVGDDQLSMVALLFGDGPDVVEVDDSDTEVNKESITVKSESELTPAEDTPGIDRVTAFETDDLLLARSSVGGGDTSSWHHHEGRDVYSYLLSGEALIKYGPEGEQSVRARKHDFLYIPSPIVHQDVNPLDDIGHDAIVGFAGEGPLVVNVEGPSER